MARRGTTQRRHEPPAAGDGPNRPPSGATPSPRKDGRRRRLRWLGLAAAILAACAVGIWLTWPARETPRQRAAQLVAEARALASRGDTAGAEESAAAALDLDPTLAEAALLAADAAESQGEFPRAVAYAGRVPPSADRNSRARAARLAARLNHHRLRRFSDAERWYRAALELDPDHIEANTGLATLLGLCGRKAEAVPHVLRLVRQGDVTDLLMLYVRESGAVDDPASLEAAHAAAPDDPNPLLGLVRRAASAGQADRALELARRAAALRPRLPAAEVALGEQLLEARRFDELTRWADALTPEALDFAAAWSVRARLAAESGDRRGAIRCDWESVRRAPESKAACFRLAGLLAQEGRKEVSERFEAHVRALRELNEAQDRALFSGGQRGVEDALNLAKAYESAGRLWEAYGWCGAAVQVEPTHADALRYLSELRRKVHDLPLRLTADAANPAYAVDLSSYPLPRSVAPPPKSAAGPVPEQSHALSFRDDAASAGLRFSYFNGTAGPPTRRMFEFTGGGVAAFDFDADGFADVAFTQGRAWPPGSPPGGQGGDRLFRNVSGERFADATDAAGIREDDFGQGIAAGDYDSDGFADLYVANIGPNRLWRNNGDGTFSDATESASVSGAGDEWTTSCLLADLTGDGLADLYAVNYVTGPDVFDRVCGTADAPRLCMPGDFDGQPDRLWVNAGDGTFLDASDELRAVAPGGKGLGVAAWDADGTGRLSVLVANDTTPNFFLVNSAENGFRLEEQGIPSGLGLNGDGKATGCMGIALGDVDGDGRTDVFITNFLAEPNTLYLSPAAGVFEDRTRELGLYRPSLDTLGFGTQFLDADLDGTLELFAANGHVDDLRRDGKPRRMRPQLFRRSGPQFAEVDPATVGPYFQDTWLGRPVARLDWNRDGREDLAVGHLTDPSALLTNTTPDAGRSLSLRLVGVTAARDAIGTTVEARIGDRTIVRQLTAGDGYQASNERRLAFGAGAADRIDELVVRWPGGRVQRFADVSLPRDACLIEGHLRLDEATPARSGR